MGKKSKKKKPRRRVQRKLTPPLAPAPTTPTDQQGPGRDVRRLLGLLAGNRLRDAVDHLDRYFPTDDEQRLATRISLLISHWPERAVQELKELPQSAFESRAVGLALADGVLLLDDESMAQLNSLPAPVIQEARLIHRAGALVSQGDDEGAKALLSKIGLRSVFRRARVFLSALLAFYAGRDADAQTLFSKVSDTEGYGGFARALLPIATLGASRGVTADICEDESAAAEELKGRYCTAREQDIIAAGKVQNQLSKNKYLGALRCFDLRQSQSPAFKNLHMDLVSALMICGLNNDKILERFRKIFPEIDDDWESQHILALMAEKQADITNAAECWSEYRAAIAEGECPSYSKEVRPLAEAAILHRYAQLELRRCQERSELGSPFGFDIFDFDEDDDFDPMTYESLAALFEQVIQDDPNHLPYWIDLLQMLELTNNQKEKNRVLERCVKQFGDHPQVLTMASKAAQKRKVFDKALKYADRALQVEPLNRGLNDLKTELLLAKAVKKLKTRGEDQGRTLIKAALAVDHQTNDSVLRTASIAMIFERSMKNEQAAVDIELSALKKVPKPWVLCAYLTQNQALFSPVKQNKRRKALAGATEIAHPETKPTADELTFFLNLAKQNRERQMANSSPFAMFLSQERSFDGMPQPIIHLINAAIVEAIDTVDSRALLEDAREFTFFTQTRLTVLERLHQLWPDDPRHVGERYEHALEMRLEPSYFASAVEDIERVLEKLPEPTRRSFDEMTPSAHGKLSDTLDEIQDYLKRKMGKPRKPKKQRCNRKKTDPRQGVIPF